MKALYHNSPKKEIKKAALSDGKRNGLPRRCAPRNDMVNRKVLLTSAEPNRADQGSNEKIGTEHALAVGLADKKVLLTSAEPNRDTQNQI